MLKKSVPTRFALAVRPLGHRHPFRVYDGDTER